MKWATREHIRVGRMGCAWLIERFIDPGAEFVFLPGGQLRAEAGRLGATLFHAEGAELSRQGDVSSFEAVLRRYDLTGDPALVLLPPEASAEDIRLFRERMGFNDPFLVQYWRFLAGALRGNFGESIRHGEPAFHLVVERMPATFELSGAALLIALSLAIPIGIVSAVRRNTIVDYVSTVIALLGQSMPTFWLGIMLILLFSVQLNLLPSSGRGELRHLVLPAITLGLFTTARITRLTRSGMLEVLSQDYIRTARAKGVRERGVIVRHGLRNALVPVVTLGGLAYAQLLTGAVMTETIFSWPGLGRYAFQAAGALDFPAITGVTLVVALTYLLVNLLVDLSYGVVDPRIVNR